jgi:Cys-tRNA(Pro) deacylase
MSWPEPVARVAAVLSGAAIDARIEEFETGTPTAQAAAEAIGCELAQIVKSIVLVSDGAYVLALVPGDRRADEAKIARALGTESVRIATAAEVVEATGFEPGGVAPFPQRAISRTLMDRSFLQHPVVWIGAGTERHMAAIPPLELARLTRAAAIDL